MVLPPLRLPLPLPPPPLLLLPLLPPPPLQLLLPLLLLRPPLLLLLLLLPARGSSPPGWRALSRARAWGLSYHLPPLATTRNKTVQRRPPGRL